MWLGSGFRTTFVASALPALQPLEVAGASHLCSSQSLLPRPVKREVCGQRSKQTQYRQQANMPCSNCYCSVIPGRIALMREGTDACGARFTTALVEVSQSHILQYSPHIYATRQLLSKGSHVCALIQNSIIMQSRLTHQPEVVVHATTRVTHAHLHIGAWQHAICTKQYRYLQCAMSWLSLSKPPWRATSLACGACKPAMSHDPCKGSIQ